MVLTRSQKRTLESDFEYIIIKRPKLALGDTEGADPEHTEGTCTDTEGTYADTEGTYADTEGADTTECNEGADTTECTEGADTTECTEGGKDPRQVWDPRGVYMKFGKLIESIYEGTFFERVPIEDRKKKLKMAFSEREISEMTSQLEALQKEYKNNAPSIIQILQSNLSDPEKRKSLEKIHCLANCEVLSTEYNTTLKALDASINKRYPAELEELDAQLLQATKTFEYTDNYREKVLKSKMPFRNKVIAYKRLEIMESYEESDSSEYAKHKNWMDTLLSIPFDAAIQPQYTQKIDYIRSVRNVLDKHLSFLEKPKDQIINIVTQQLRNPNCNINAIGLYGVKGVGKTKITQSISEALGRPFRTISLGGESDSSILTGHHFTYVGSTPGRLIDILRETNCTNPIILFDELDKVSSTNHGKEIIGNLIHLTDTSTNNKYNYDRYFAGLEFDLSKVLFVFTYNDATKVDRILLDRLFKIKIDNYTFKEKLEITNKHIIKNVLSQFDYNDQVTFADEAVEYIVKSSKDDEGMRDIKRKFEIIVSRINTLFHTQSTDNVVRLRYNSLYPFYTTLPVKVPQDHIDTLLCDSFSRSDNDDTPIPFGMYV
ncbi:MAG: AAA family ATPase [Proteobacteria bacterium]|nr:AAA family ATPase [Pseudomonadota bacterium]NBP13151.1 AAA family ATPase [bacterium]